MKTIAQILGDAKNGVYGDVHSLIVFQNDEILLEEYFGGYDEDSIHYQYSVTKSVASMLIGIALDKGLISSVDDRLLSFFPEYESRLANMSADKEGLTLKHVLTMSTGFKWDEWTYSYTDSRNDANKMIRSNDMMKFVLDLPMVRAPGSRFTYNSGCSMLLSGIIESSTGLTAQQFAKEHLFDKLGIGEWRWEQGNDQKFNTGWGLHLRPKDMLKIGQLVLNNGIWNGEQIVSQAWLNESKQNHISNYGYQWWLSGDSFSARGWGGQTIAIAPEDDLVVISTAGNFGGGSPPGLQVMNRLRR